MSTEDFVTREQAVELKELGFNLPVNHYYKDDKLIQISGYSDNYCNANANAVFVIDECYSAPTIYQAHKWLIDNKGICIEIFGCVVDKNWAYTLSYISGDKYGLSVIDEDKKSIKRYGFVSYEDALSDGIDQIIKYLKNLKTE